MNMLAVDCCLKLTGTALMTDGKIMAQIQGDLGRKQSSELPKMSEKVLKSANLTWPELDYIALTNGPGYFTGIRVGAAYASGLAYASGAEIIPISTLELLPFTFRKNHDVKKILTLIYAGHGFVYASCDKFLEAGEYPHSKILSWLSENQDAVAISDDPERTGLNIDIFAVKPDILSLCEIAHKNIDRAISPMELKISYYRAPQGAEGR